MWTRVVVPLAIQRQLLLERSSQQWHHGKHVNDFLLQRLDEPLDHGNAALLSDGSQAMANPASFAPLLEIRAVELGSMITDEVLGHGSDLGALLAAKA